VTDSETTLELAADPVSLRLVRLVAAALADESGLDFEDVEDVRLAVDELCAAVISATSDGGRLRVTLKHEPGAVTVDGVAPAGDRPPRLDPLSAEIVAAVTDDHSLTQVDGVCHFRFVKRHASDQA